MRSNSWFSKVGAVIGLAALVCTSGCSGFSNASSGSNSSQTSTTYAYVSEYGIGTAKAIAQFQVASDGTLTPLTPATIEVTAGGGPAWIIADPSNRYLFAAGMTTPDLINQFVISADGMLTPNTVATVSGGDSFYPFVFTPSSFAVVPSIATSSVGTFSLSSSGSLTQVGTYPSGLDPISATFDPSGKYVYVGCVGNGYGTIYAYSLASDGSLTPLSPQYSPAGVGVDNLAVSPKGFLYAVNRDGGSVTAFQIDESTGALANAGTFPTGTAGQSQPNWIAFDPTGSYAYVTNFTDNSVSQFAVNATTGALTMNGPDVPTGQGPLQVAVDPSGEFVFVPQGFSLSQFKIDTTGRLIPNGTTSLGSPSPVSPMAIAFAQR